MAPASGCYLAHLARGQATLLCARRPIEALLADPATPGPLRERLERVDAVRAYAAGLGLAVGDRYTQYAAWPGDYVVVTVVATRPGEVDPVTRWYPVVGRVPYRGYFDAARAAAHAAALREEGLDVCEVPVPAYSTLGWFDDPVTGPMVREDEGQLVETLFHELLHATVFVPGDADFNEGVANFVGQEARVRFYRDTVGPEAEARERQAVTRERRVGAEILALRRAVESLYAGTPPGPDRDARRVALERRARDRIAALGSGAEASRADRLRLNDACLALSGTYHALTPRLAVRLDREGGDLAAFIAAASRAAETDAPARALLDDPAPDPAAAGGPSGGAPSR